MTQWGPAGWTFLHCAGFAYPDAPTLDDRRRMYAFLRSVGPVLPCRRCRSHCEAYVRSHLPGPHAPPLASREAASRFLVDMHNDVNRRLGKAEVPFDVVQKEYEVEADAQWVDGALVASAAVLVLLLVLYLARRVPARGDKS